MIFTNAKEVARQAWEGMHNKNASGVESGLLYSYSSYSKRYRKVLARTGNVAQARSSAWRAVRKTGLNSLHSAWHMSFAGQMMFNAPMAAFAAATAPRGQKVSAAGGALGAGFGSLIGGLVLGTPGALVGGFLADSFFGEKITGALQRVKDVTSQSRRVNMGGDFIDSEAAFTMRQAAAREMAGSLMNARQYLGQEGALFHS